MIASAVFITTLILLVLLLGLLQVCQFLIPYRHVLFGHYGSMLLAFAAALFINLFAAVYLVSRFFFLKDTGRKLAHLERQLGAGELSDDLARRLRP